MITITKKHFVAFCHQIKEVIARIENLTKHKFYPISITDHVFKELDSELLIMFKRDSENVIDLENKYSLEKIEFTQESQD